MIGVMVAACLRGIILIIVGVILGIVYHVRIKLFFEEWGKKKTNNGKSAGGTAKNDAAKTAKNDAAKTAKEAAAKMAKEDAAEAFKQAEVLR